MKRITLLIAFMALTLVSSCKNDDDAVTGPSPVQNSWYLINVTGGIAGTSYNFEPGTITWKFGNSNDTVIIDNKNTDASKEDFFSSGTYHYSFVTNTVTPQNCSETLKVDNMDFGCYSFGPTGYLTLTQTEADGFTLTFVTTGVMPL